MKRILFFEIPTFTGATRVTRTMAKKVRGHFETNTTVIKDYSNPKKEILDAIEQEKPDILFSSFTTINPDVIEVGKGKGLIVVVRSDYKLKDITKDAKDRVIETYSEADWVIAQTHELKQEMLHSIPCIEDKRIKVIENPLDEEDILEKSSEPNPFPNNGKFHFLWVGRKDPIKDLPTLQKAFELVHAEYPNTDLTLISDDPNPYKWMKFADCLVICSKSEASPNVLFEASLLGIKVISTNCSPIVLQNLPSNMIVKVGDVFGLAYVMRSLLS